MENKIDDGGPAFPIQGITVLPNGDQIWPEPGMSLRDYFAIKFAHAEVMTAGAFEEPRAVLVEAAAKNGQSVEDRIAFNAYRLADAMIAARKGKS